MAGLCPKCKVFPDKFTLHDYYDRKIREIKGDNILTNHMSMSLWKCSSCGRCSALYPDFILPYARFTRESMESKVEQYLYSIKENYRTSAKHDGDCILHIMDGLPTDVAFNKSTIWHWMTVFEKQREQINSHIQELKEYNPELSLFRQYIDISSNKYRSLERKNCLEDVLIYLQIYPLWKKHQVSDGIQ